MKRKMNKKKLILRIKDLAGHQWLTSVILAAQKTEIWRITIRNQPRQIVGKTLSQQQQKKNHKKGLVKWLKV
jgi:hypothetical protein